MNAKEETTVTCDRCAGTGWVPATFSDGSVFDDVKCPAGCVNGRLLKSRFSPGADNQADHSGLLLGATDGLQAEAKSWYDTAQKWGAEAKALREALSECADTIEPIAKKWIGWALRSDVQDDVAKMLAAISLARKRLGDK